MLVKYSTYIATVCSGMEHGVHQDDHTYTLVELQGIIQGEPVGGLAATQPRERVPQHKYQD